MKTAFLSITIFLSAANLLSQDRQYWNRNNNTTPWRFPLAGPEGLKRIDWDQDGKPDAIAGCLMPDSVPYIWIGEPGTMAKDALEGNPVNDLLLVDRNKDGYYDGPDDLVVKWGDENGNKIPDLMMVIQNGSSKIRSTYDWNSDYMIVIDKDEEGILNYIDWNKLELLCWEHDGHADFYPDYQGNTLFLKMHASSYRIDDLRYSWENPFLFFSTDTDRYTEWTIRLVDLPYFRNKTGDKSLFNNLPEAIDVKFSQKITDVRASWDMDNDNGPGNEFDYDMSIKLIGPGFDYSDQVHQFKSLKTMAKIPADTFLFDPRWLDLDQLIFPGRENAWNLVWNKGQWKECHFVFDEDDDCNRWERVEFYDPLDPFISGTRKGGIDNNQQADVAGDRGNWDMDFSGKGNLYVSPFDGRIHLFGAETGIWRIDQMAFYFQGFGGNYGRWAPGRLQRHAETFATVKYSDTDGNGFFDLIEFDLDGDKAFEDRLSLLELGVNDKCKVIETASMDYGDFAKLFEEIAESSFKGGLQAVKAAESQGLNTYWYNFYKKPNSISQKYQYGFWLEYYIFRDLRQLAIDQGDEKLRIRIEKAYCSNDWDLLVNDARSIKRSIPY